ncbi:MAG: A/G-specific adenine glycosylase [Canibacter sp.]
MSEQLPSIFADARERDSFASAISEWFRENARELPWRGAIDPWHVLVSEFMLQQTQVERVWPRFIEWIERWPTPADLANSEPAEALRAWDRLGYPRRALWLHRAAVEITDRFGGVVPSDPAALEQLTGVGPYTARAVSTFAYGERHPVVDTNTRRVLARALHGLAAAGSPSPRDLADQELLLPLDQSAAAEFNAGIMELGAVVCTARTPSCAVCPVAKWCQWRGAGYPDNAPAKRPKQKKFAGSDREARGKIMALLRNASHAVSRTDALTTASADAVQAARAVDSLVTDGLIVEVDAGMLALPTAQ